MSEITRDLLSRLKRQGSTERDLPNAPLQPTVSSPLFSPSPSGPQPHHASAILSPVTSAVATPTAESANRPAPDLLSLFKLRQANPASDVSPFASSDYLPSLGSSALQTRPAPPPEGVAGFVRKPSSIVSRSSSLATPTAVRPEASRPELRGEAAVSSAANPQDYLLKLLNQAKPAISIENLPIRAADVPMPSVEKAIPVQDTVLTSQVANAPVNLMATPGNGKASPIRVFGEPSAEPSPFEAPTSNATAKKNIFTATNPFDFLSASSPRNRTPGPVASGTQDTPTKSTFSFGDLTASEQINGSAPTAQSNVAVASVGEKVDAISEQVSKQVEQALAAVTGQAAQEPVIVDATKNVASTEDVGENWEDEPIATPSAQEPVRVFSFPMKPFISITIGKFDEPARAIDVNTITEIARLKKEFDQIDRNLVSATQNYIVYPLKAGGFRVIEQESGSHKQIFSSLQERIFNISIGRAMKSADADVETVVGTGINGTVLWSSMGKFPKDSQYGDQYEDRGFTFPATPANDENTSGGQLKTRVKPSSRTPEAFAYGRGKLIHIIYPGVARNSTYTNSSRECQTEKYLKEHTAVIHTKKAGKDFAFSADDTVIATLDKAGALKFWDIRKLTDPACWLNPSPQSPIEIKHPILELATCNPEDKSWPTSVMFLDKEKPMARGIALRYMIVGMKQNHTLQLWDLSLLKPVEEINFPHDSESDAICSLAYHPKSGMLAVGHPTRNSIYLLSISAPKYNLPVMGQHKYLNMLATQDKTLPPPESTIIVSGAREFSLGDKGQLRSLDILADPLTATEENSALFELYVMHSKGITNLSVNRTMLGWSKEGRTLDPVNAQAAGMIEVRGLTPLPGPIFPTPGATSADSMSASTNGEATPAKAAKIEASKKEKAKAARSPSPPPAPVAAPVSAPKAAEETPATNGADKFEKVEKKKNKKKTSPETPNTSVSTSAAPAPVAQMTPIPAQSSTPNYHEGIPSTSLLTSEPSTWASQLFPSSAPASETAKAAASTTDYQPLLNSKFDELYRKIAEDRRIQDAQNNAKQGAILSLVSTSLTDNIEPVMTRIVTDALTKIVGGPLKDVIATSIDRNLQSVIAQNIKQTVPNEIKSGLNSALRQALDHPQLLSAITEQVSKKVTRTVETQLHTAMVDNILPQFTALASTAAANATSKIEQQLNEKLRIAEVQRQSDATKIDALVKSVASMQESLAAMAEHQRTSQAETAELIKQLSSAAAVPAVPTTPSRQGTPGGRGRRSMSKPPQKVVEKTPEQIEAEGIQEQLRVGNYEAATIQWLQSTHQAHLFDTLFVTQPPQILSSMSPLVVLSVCAAVTFSLETNIPERLSWLETALSLVDPSNRDFVDVFPRIMDIITQRLQKAYMEIAQVDMRAPVLRGIAGVAGRVGEVRGVHLREMGGLSAGL